MVRWEDAFSLRQEFAPDGSHIWRYDPLCPVQVRFFKYDVRHSVGLNRHAYLELFYVASGSLRFHIQGRSIPVSPGDLCIVGPNNFHTMEFPPDSGARARARGVGLFFLPDFVVSSDRPGEEAELLSPFLAKPTERTSVVRHGSAASRRVFELMKEMESQLPARTPRAQLAVRTCLRMALLRVLQHQSTGGNLTGLGDRQAELDRLRPVFEHLAARYREPIPLAFAARLAGVSESKFVRSFRRATGSSFVAYLNRFRIARAQHLLAATGKSVAEIGYEVGFSGQSYFGLLFKRAVGVSPLQYRRRVAS